LDEIERRKQEEADREEREKEAYVKEMSQRLGELQFSGFTWNS
jgi:hypothetical protein